MQRLLAPIDFSPVTLPVVKQAALLARRFGARLWLLHVAAPDPEFIGYEPGPQSVRDQLAARFRKEHRALQRKARQLQSCQVQATPLLVQGPTVEVILKEAKRLKANLIILGSHGHGPLRRVLLGSVSEGVMRHAACPVLIVPSVRRRRREST